MLTRILHFKYIERRTNKKEIRITFKLIIIIVSFYFIQSLYLFVLVFFCFVWFVRSFDPHWTLFIHFFVGVYFKFLSFSCYNWKHTPPPIPQPCGDSDKSTHNILVCTCKTLHLMMSRGFKYLFSWTDGWLQIKSTTKNCSYFLFIFCFVSRYKSIFDDISPIFSSLLFFFAFIFWAQTKKEFDLSTI